VLLSSIQGASVYFVKIKDVPHEFTTIRGVLEDVTDIVLSLKKLVIRMNTDEPRVLRIDVHEKGEVKGAHIMPDPMAEVLNPDMHIATLSEDVDFVVEIGIRKGRGYTTAEENKPAEHEIGLVPVDSAFSPVTKVNFTVENTRVGKLSNYDRLVLDVWTNGAITPEAAIVEASKILRTHLNPFVQYFEIGREIQMDQRKEEEARKRAQYLKELKQKLDLPLSELDLSVRASNCLKGQSIQTIGELVRRAESDLLKLKNFGKTSLKEVKKKLGDMGMSPSGKELVI
jgi:DNA-directed RNA polymerase subunit alpha